MLIFAIAFFIFLIGRCLLAKSDSKGKLYLKVLAFIKPYKWLMLTAVLLNLGFSLFNTLSVALIKPLFQILFKTNDVPIQQAQTSFLKDIQSRFFDYLFSFIKSESMNSTLIKFGILIVLIFLIKNLFKYWGTIYSSKFEEGIVKSIRDKVFAKLTNLSLDFFNKTKQGTLISVIANDVGTVNQTMIASFSVLLREASQVVFLLFLLLSISVELTLIAFSTSIFSITIIRTARKFLKRYATRMQKALADYTGTISEIVSGIRVVKAYNAEKHAVDRFETDSRFYVKSAVKHKIVVAIIPSINEVFAIAAMTIVLLVGAMRINDHQLSPDNLMLFLFSLFQIMSPITSVLNQFVQFPRGFVSAERIFEILDSEPTIKDGNEDFKSFESGISVKNVSFAYNDTEVIKNVDLHIPKGKKVAFVGASGSGKSTMLDLLIRFYDPSAGIIEIDGKNIKDFKIESYRKLFGIVSQETMLFNDTVANNIKFGGFNSSEEDLINAAKLSNSYNFISKMENGFETMLGDRGVNLSGGERQRVAIARALLRNPEILVFDEATSALDAESEKIVQDAINESLKNKTAILVAHRLSTIINCDEIIVFEKGEIVERGNHLELLELNGVYKKLYDIQFNEANNLSK